MNLTTRALNLAEETHRMMNVKETKYNNKKYELLAPDGGWGYMIGLGVILNLVCLTSFVNCFGLIFKELFSQLKMDSTSIALFNGVNDFFISISGFMTSPLLSYMSVRKLGLAAALVFNLGIFGTVFVKSEVLFFFTQGILQSIGHGVIYNLSFTMLNEYFERRRLLAISFTQAVVGACVFFTPHLVKWSLEAYGLRGTLLLISGVSMHNILGMTLMHPVAWYMRRGELPENKENETQTLLVEDKHVTNNKEDLTASIKSHNLDHSIEGTDWINKPHEEIVKDNTDRPKKLFRFIDVALFKTFLLSNASVGVSLCIFSEVTFTVMLPQALYFMGWNETEVSRALSLNALGDLVTRILFIFMSRVLVKYGSHEIYVAGLAIAFMSRLGMLWSDNRRLMITCITIMGVSRCTIILLSPIVVADAVDRENFTSALGLLFLIVGFFKLTVGPVIGTVRDLTDNYTTIFYILTSFFGIVIMFWLIELLYKKNEHKRQPTKTVSSSKL